MQNFAKSQVDYALGKNSMSSMWSLHSHTFLKLIRILQCHISLV